jgi:hypothetical protein
MKKNHRYRKVTFEYVVVGFLIILSMLFQNAKVSNKNIIGTWKGVENGLEIIMSFDSYNECLITFEDKSKDQISSIKGDYIINLEKYPIPLTIRNIPQLSHPLHTIVEFTAKDIMKVGEFSSDLRLRPIIFNMGKSIYLKKE